MSWCWPPSTASAHHVARPHPRRAPAHLDVRTGEGQAQQQTNDLESQLGFLRTFLLIFAYVALFVGAFIIFNTFSITVAQRTREFGLLRMLGATRGQVLRSVVAEGVMLGLIGSAIGLLAGLGLAPALDQLFKAFRRRPSRQRHRGRAAHRVGVVAGGHRGNRARRSAAGAARLAGDPVRRSARASRCTKRPAAASGAGASSRARRDLVAARLVALASSGAGVVTISCSPRSSSRCAFRRCAGGSAAPSPA